MIRTLCVAAAACAVSLPVMAQPAHLTSPAPGAVLEETQQFLWEDTGAEAYQITIGTHPAGQDVAVSPLVYLPEVTTEIEPNGHPVYVTLSSLADGEWHASAPVAYVAPGIMLTLPECTETTKLWVLDVGTEIAGTSWVTASSDPKKGQVHRFTAAASSHEGSPSQQADVGCGNGNYWSRGRWDLSGTETLSFSLKDLNHKYVGSDHASTLNHYVLLYDHNYRYHQWLLDDPNGANKLTFRPGEWVDVTVALSDDPSTYYNSGYNLDEPFDWSEVIFFEVGIFGEEIAPADAISWEVGSVHVD